MAGESVVLRFEGTFDAAECWRLREALAGSSPAAAVTLDFTGVRVFHDFAVALLAKELADRRGAVAVRGLRQHQRRLLRYFGVDAAGLDPLAPELDLAEERA